MSPKIRAVFIVNPRSECQVAVAARSASDTAINRGADTRFRPVRDFPGNLRPALPDEKRSESLFLPLRFQGLRLELSQVVWKHSPHALARDLFTCRPGDPVQDERPQVVVFPAAEEVGHHDAEASPGVLALNAPGNDLLLWFLGWQH